ncbi:MAG: protein-tyrosine-phosphatase [Lachnospiraceae bacterium]|nr:protein-tyrosine-phosphatase [Lachnospiraceae bacterium]
MTDYYPAKELVDIHCHILPNVDDGSDGFDSTLKMLKTAKDEGITRMIATPHFKKGHHNVSPKSAEKLLEEIRTKAEKEGISLKLYLGNEVMYFSDVEEAFEEGKINRINGTDNLLIEFYPDDEYSRIRRGIETVQSMGFTPILAHVERYLELRKDTSKIEHLKAVGAVITVNASSVTGDAGFLTKQFVKGLLRRKLVDMIGTDAHDTSNRAPRMKKCAEYLYSKYEEEYVDEILFKNAIDLFELD